MGKAPGRRHSPAAALDGSALRAHPSVLGSAVAALLLIAACGGKSSALPPPAHLDPEYADAGPAVKLNQPWPQNGPFYCHAVAREGQATAMCARSQVSCEQWRVSNQDKGFTVGPCSQELEATCFRTDDRELCFETAEQCADVREAMAADGRCNTIKAAWTPE